MDAAMGGPGHKHFAFVALKGGYDCGQGEDMA